ncbi:restriction endonuclease subunit S [Micromonospora sp. NPDC048887]|uniref:restriction endonuclease subunit S n=1 Tax=Micromonospora sp. NPDC048887 TaxID=3155614 RepID=UPI0033DE77D9
MTTLPRGWVQVPLSDVADVQGGIQKQAKRRPIKNKFPFLRVANVHRGKLNLVEVHEVELFDGELARFELHKGDLLVVEGNGSPDQIGRAAIWDGSIPNCVHQNHLIRVRPTSALSHEYLELIWNSPPIARHLRSAAGSTSGLYTLSTAKVKAVPIPLPPVPEQALIVSRAKEVLSRVDRLLEAIQGVERKAAGLRSSLLAEALKGQLVSQDSDDEPASVAVARIRAERAVAPPRARSRNASSLKTGPASPGDASSGTFQQGALPL